MFIGEEFGSMIRITKRGEADYHAVMTILQRRSIDLVDWEERNLDITAYGTDKNETVGEVYTTMQMLLEKCKNDLFNLAESEEDLDKIDSKPDTEN